MPVSVTNFLIKFFIFSFSVSFATIIILLVFDYISSEQIAHFFNLSSDSQEAFKVVLSRFQEVTYNLINSIKVITQDSKN